MVNSWLHRWEEQSMLKFVMFHIWLFGDIRKRPVYAWTGVATIIRSILGRRCCKRHQNSFVLKFLIVYFCCRPGLAWTSREYGKSDLCQPWENWRADLCCWSSTYWWYDTTESPKVPVSKNVEPHREEWMSISVLLLS